MRLLIVIMFLFSFSWTFVISNPGGSGSTYNNTYVFNTNGIITANADARYLSSNYNGNVTINGTLTTNYLKTDDLYAKGTATLAGMVLNGNGVAQFYNPSTFFGGINATALVGTTVVTVNGIVTANTYYGNAEFNRVTFNAGSTVNFMGTVKMGRNKPVLFETIEEQPSPPYTTGFRLSTEGGEGLFFGTYQPATQISFEHGYNPEDTPSFNSTKGLSLVNNKVGIRKIPATDSPYALEVNGIISGNTLTGQSLTINLATITTINATEMTIGDGDSIMYTDAAGGVIIPGNVTANGNLYVTNYLNLPASTFGFVLDGGGVTPSIRDVSGNFKTYGKYRVVEPLTMSNWWLDSDITGNVTVDILINDTSAVGVGTKPSLVALKTNTASTSGWNIVDLSINDVVSFKIEEDIATLTNLTITIKTVQQ